MDQFVIVKTEDLSDLALDWAVDAILSEEPTTVHLKKDGTLGFVWQCQAIMGGIDNFSSSWAKGGPLIGKARILFAEDDKGFAAYVPDGVTMHGPDHLIAGMRCFVASRLGLEIKVPTLLLNPESKVA